MSDDGVEIWASAASVASACNSISRADHAAYAANMPGRAAPTRTCRRPAWRARDYGERTYADLRTGTTAPLSAVCWSQNEPHCCMRGRRFSNKSLRR